SHFSLPPGGPAPLSKLRVVLLGEAGAGKAQVASLLLGTKDLKEASELCVLHKSKHAGRKICVVDTPGWDRHSIHNTSENIKDEIVTSVSLCPPGPHVLILVLPVANFTEPPSADELETVQKHLELLSERVWKHTMVLFLCNEEVEETTVKKHIRNTTNLLRKCGNRYCVLQHADSETQAHALREKIEDTVRADNFFMPQIYYDMIQKKDKQHEDTERKGDKQQSEEQSEKTELRQRRGSLQGTNPNRVEVRALCRPVEILNIKLIKPFIYGAGFVHGDTVMLEQERVLPKKETTVNQDGHSKGTLTSRRSRRRSVLFIPLCNGARYMITKDHTVSVSELRIVLLGRAGAGKSKTARFLLGINQPEGELGSCIMLKGEAAGRRIYLVDTPGWDRHAIYNTPEKIRNETIRSVTLCPPGPHVLIVVLRVESLTDAPSAIELEAISEHMELLSERAWKHTMLLFLCDEDVEDPIINEHIQKANRLLGKCGNRHFVLRSEAQVPEFLQEIEKVVEGNCGDFSLPLSNYNSKQVKAPKNVPEMEQMYDGGKPDGQTVLMHRRGSYTGDPPSMEEDDQTGDTVAAKLKYWVEMLGQHYLKPAVWITLVIIGALLKRVAGSE
ncbi:hypothetical protein NFI96_020080, partial [Prochilodus magdalenae]